jgi:hypothetical protein
LRRIGWIGVVTGTVVALVAGWLIFFAMPDFYTMIAYEEKAGGITVSSTDRQTTAHTLEMIVVAASCSLALFLGRMARASSGLNGMVITILGALILSLWYSWEVFPVIVSALADSVSRDEDLGNVSFWVMMFSIYLPFALLVSFAGGRVGGLLRTRSIAG